MIKLDPMKIFDRIIGVVFAIMLFFFTLGIIVGAARLFFNLGDLLLSGDITRHYVRIISEVLTLFILIELSRSLVDYFSEHRLRLTFIVDAGIVFVLREIMIGLFEHKITTGEIYALGALLFVLGCLRIGSVLVFQREKAMLEAAKSHRERG
ncbi:MAG: phosphate-starvation-inducible PsiE family protein [Pseudomonadota bacterium]